MITSLSSQGPFKECFRVAALSTWESEMQRDFFELRLHNKQLANLGRLCFWLPDFRYPQPDLHEYFAPRTPTEIKKLTQCLCKSRLWHPKPEARKLTAFFQNLDPHPLSEAATESNAKFSLSSSWQNPTQFLPLQKSNKTPLKILEAACCPLLSAFFFNPDLRHFS